MHDKVVMTILTYIEDHLFEPSRTWPNDIFAHRAYARWAACEIIQLVMDNPLEDPRILIEGFAIKMIAYSNLYTPSNGCNMFTVAEDVANDILQLI